MIQQQLAKLKNQGGVVFLNSSFLMIHTLSGSVLGFLFWTVAARTTSSIEVGIGVAFIAAVTLIAALGDMGLGTTLIRFMPSLGRNQGRFLNTSLIAVAVTSLLFAIIFALGTPIWSQELELLTQSGLHFALFVTAALSFSLAQFLDRLYIAFESSQFLLARNLAANVLKIALVVALASRFGATGLLIAVGLAAFITLGFSLSIFVPRTLPGYRANLDFAWPVLIEKARYSLGNHFSEFLWSAPARLFPLIIIAVLGAEANAYFYTSWMVANLVFMIPTAVSTAAFARAANQSHNSKNIWEFMGFTLISLIPVVGLLIMLSDLLLGIFGPEYVSEAHRLFVLLLLSVFPFTVNTFVITHYRIQQAIREMVWVSSVLTMLSVALVLAFAMAYGLTGIGWGWLISQIGGIVIILIHHFRPGRLAKTRKSAPHYQPVVNATATQAVSKPTVLYVVMPFASAANVKYAGKLIDCLALACHSLLVVGDRRLDNDHLPRHAVHYKNLSTLHYLNTVRPLPWSMVLWGVKLVWVMGQAAWAVVETRREVDTVICHQGIYHTPILLTARLLGKKTIFFEPSNGIVAADVNYKHGLAGRMVIRLMQLLRRANRNLAHLCAIESPHGVEQAQLQPYLHKTRFTSSHVDTDFYRMSQPLPERAPLIGFLSRLTREKGILEFLEAAALLHDCGLSFQIVGDGPLKSEIENRLRQPNLSHVSLLGWSDTDTIVQHLNNFRLMVLPTAGEGIPNVILEAMACGTPVLATAVGGIPDLIRNAQTGFVLPNQDPGIIAMAIEQTITHPCLAQISQQGRVHILQNYSLIAVSEKWQQIFQELAMIK